MKPQDRDRVRIKALLTVRRGEAFTAAELAQVTGLTTARVTTAGDALVKAGMIRREGDYFWAPRPGEDRHG